MTKKVIIIDDSITLLNILKTEFIKKNWDVYVAQNVKSVYEMIYDIIPDLIITDALMPVEGGFQFVKNLRADTYLSKIPVIIYSILGEAHAKYYISEDLGEYFLKKSENIQDLLDLAQNAIRRHPLSEAVKNKISQLNPKINQDLTSKIDIKPDENIVNDDIISQIKKIKDYTQSDEILFSKLFSGLYSILNYDLLTINTYSFEKGTNCVYFDIRNIILSPILKNFILKKYDTKENILLKNYSPNLKSPLSIDEFSTKCEFSFFYKENINVAIYSLNEANWSDFQIHNIKLAIEDFIKSRYISKTAKNKISYGNLSNYIHQPKGNDYFAVISIANFNEIKDYLADEEIDTINSKILQKIMDFIEKDEKLNKNNDDEYTLIIHAQDEKHAQNRLKNICESLNLFSYNDLTLSTFIGATSFKGLNLYEAQKIAKDALDDTTKEEKVVINYAGK